MHLPNGKDRTVYQFSNMLTNTIFNGFKNVLDVFVRPGTPFGWQHQVVEAPRVVDPAPTAQQPQPAGAEVGGSRQEAVGQDEPDRHSPFPIPPSPFAFGISAIQRRSTLVPVGSMRFVASGGI